MEKEPKWQAEMFRVTFFCSEEPSLTDEDWKIVSGESEAPFRNPVPGGRRLAGELLGGELSATLSGRRFDWILAASQVPGADPTTAGFATLGPWKQTCDSLLTILRDWMAMKKYRVLRIALGSVALSPERNLEDAYQRLAVCLKSVHVEPTKMRDFLYRVNWPTASTSHPSLLLNRLTTWSAVQTEGLVFQVGAGAMEAIRVQGASHAARLEIDHNTAADRNAPFHRDELVTILLELAALAAENLDVGEAQ